VIRVVGNTTLIDHTTRLGSRRTVAGVEHTLIGMKVGGYRKVRISPHLAYRDKGVPGHIPADAVLVVEVWLRAIVGEGKVATL
jgi:FKBP-type peptidyl-prolyl cis-trans isomerase